MKLSELFMIWWIFGYTWKTLLELWEIMWQEKEENGHFIFTWF